MNFISLYRPTFRLNQSSYAQSVRSRTPCRSLLALTFFGLTQEYKANLHKVIFSMIYYGKGGFNFNDLYNMPVFLRSFYLKEMNTAVEKENAEYDKVKSKSRK